MKKFIIFFYFLTTILFCQKSTKDSPLIEIFVLAKSDSNNQSGTNVDFTLSNVGTAWRAIPWSYPKTFEISNLVNGGTVTAILDATYSKYTGFNYSYTGDHSYPEFAFGFYKLSALGKYIYLDYRDYDYGSYSGSTGHNADIWIKYDFSDSKLYLSSYSVSSSTDWGQPLANGQYLPIWEIKNQGIPNTNNIPNFWQNCLVLIRSDNNHPRLVWGTYPNGNAIGYYLYRKITENSGMITTTKIPISSSTTSYLDNEFEIGFPLIDVVEYWVTARLTSTTESVESNHVKTQGEYTPYKLNEQQQSEKKLLRFQLDNSYPNPFNPSTNITYQLPKKGHVALKVYNTLGKEVVELVNETKEEGTYSVTFNGDNLPSGMYFYKIETGEFVEVKKMLLLK